MKITGLLSQGLLKQKTNKQNETKRKNDQTVTILAITLPYIHAFEP